MKDFCNQCMHQEGNSIIQKNNTPQLPVDTEKAEVSQISDTSKKTAYYFAGADYVIDSYDGLKTLLHDLSLKFAYYL